MAIGNPVIRLADFLARFAKAGAEAAQECARESRRHLLEFFQEKDGDLIAKVVKVNAGGRDVEVPLLAITQPASVRFSEMELKFGLSVDISTKGETFVHNHRKLLKKAVDVDVVMRFDTSESPEGFELLRDRFNQDLSSALGNIVPETPLTPAKEKE